MDLFEQYILKALKAAPMPLGEVVQLVHVQDLPFKHETYPKLLEGLKNGNLPEPSEQGKEETDFRQYLIIYKIIAENGAVYLGTFYDSDALEQDPQLIDLIAVKS